MFVRGALRHSQRSSTSRMTSCRPAVLWFKFDLVIINYVREYESGSIDFEYCVFAMTYTFQWAGGLTFSDCFDNSRSRVSSLFPLGTGLRFYRAAYCSSYPLLIDFRHFFPTRALVLSAREEDNKTMRDPTNTTVIHTPPTLTSIPYTSIKNNCTSQLIV